MNPSNLLPLIQNLINLLEENKFEEIDEILKLTDVKIIEPEIMVALLRTTFPAKTLIKYWYNFFDDCFDELKRRNLDAYKILKMNS